MAKTKTIDGPTPNGNVSGQVTYLNDAGEVVDEKEATGGEVVEFDAGGEMVFRTYFRLAVDPDAPPFE